MATPPSPSSDGPVLTVINKRLRALRKKLNRIHQMEESLARGKSLNKDQEEVLRLKSSILAGIEELEKIRQPLGEAVNREIELALEEHKATDEKREAKKASENPKVAVVADLICLLYFGSMFDVDTLVKARINLLTRAHERSCCLTYECITDGADAAEPLEDWDLELISMMARLLISQPADSYSSHKVALQKCVEHAMLWVSNSEQPIEPNTNITYAGLKEKLNKIMAMDYFTAAPEIKPPVELAAAVDRYTSSWVPAHRPLNAQLDFSEPIGRFPAKFVEMEEESRDSDSSQMPNDETGC